MSFYLFYGYIFCTTGKSYLQKLVLTTSVLSLGAKIDKFTKHGPILQSDKTLIGQIMLNLMQKNEKILAKAIA